MGTVYAEITLKNARDVGNALAGIVTDNKVREAAVQAVVDTGAMSLIINEELRDRLGLTIAGRRQASLANGAKQFYQVTEPVDILWKDRAASCRALVVPGAGAVLLGVIQLEDLDLMVDPVRQELKGAHGDEALYSLY